MTWFGNGSASAVTQKPPQQNRARGRRALAAASLALGLGSAAAAQVVSLAPAEPQNVMSLTATASVEVPLDLLSITFSTTREGADAAQVQAQLKQALDAALAEARKVAKPGQVDVRTGNFSLTPRYAPKGGLNGWQGTAQLQVEGRDTAAISQLAGRIQTLSIAGVGQGLSREGREKVEADITAQAISRFRERALAQSQLFGFTGFVIREVQVGTDGGAPPPSMVRMRAMASAAEESLPVQAGRTTVNASVSGSVQMLK